jgi:hypothetical protein
MAAALVARVAMLEQAGAPCKQARGQRQQTAQPGSSFLACAAAASERSHQAPSKIASGSNAETT